MKPAAALIALLPLLCNPLAAQDPYPAPVATGNLVVELVDVATLPDSDSGNSAPARVSVITEDPLGRLVAADQRGPVYLFDEVSGNVTEYLDLRDYPDLKLDSSSGERGLQAVAFHPDFADPEVPGYGRFYTISTADDPGGAVDFDPGPGANNAVDTRTFLVEWRTASPGSDNFAPAEPGTPNRVMISFNQPYNNHNAGLVAFNPTVLPGDPDYGNLYVAMGDGGSSGDPQDNAGDPSNPYGAILRIDPLGDDSANGRYGIVIENVLATDTTPGTLGEIYCYGLRNPQRFGWDAATGAMYIADIGQNAIEEIDLAVNGGDYGWNAREGSIAFNGGVKLPRHIDPVAEYGHFDTFADFPDEIQNRAVTCGEVARGSCIPGLDGNLVAADFPNGILFLYDTDNAPTVTGQEALVEIVPVYEGAPTRLRDIINAARLARDPALATTSRADLRFSVNTLGRVFVSNKRDGIIRRFVASSEPTAALSPDGGGLSLEFNGVLQESDDLETWRDRIPQPLSPWTFGPGEKGFFRAERR